MCKKGIGVLEARQVQRLHRRFKLGRFNRSLSASLQLRPDLRHVIKDQPANSHARQEPALRPRPDRPQAWAVLLVGPDQFHQGFDIDQTGNVRLSARS